MLENVEAVGGNGVAKGVYDEGLVDEFGEDGKRGGGCARVAEDEAVGRGEGMSVKCGEGIVEEDVEKVGLVKRVMWLEERGYGDSVAGADSREESDGGK